MESLSWNCKLFGQGIPEIQPIKSELLIMLLVLRIIFGGREKGRKDWKK